MATKMKLPIIVLCILSVVLTIGLVAFEKGRFGDEELSTLEDYSEEIYTLDEESYLFEYPSEEELITTLEYNEKSEIKTTLLDMNKKTLTSVVSTTKKAEETTKKTAAENTETEGYEMYFTSEDVQMVAKTIYGEAGSSWISRADKAKVAWTILNRVDDSRWPNTISAVITQPYQFYGYKSNHPVTAECREIAEDVLIRWSMEKQGVEVYREAAKNITAFYGDGRNNHFYVY